MNAFAHFPAHLHWNAQQLADAVPARLHELFALDAFDVREAANAMPANRERRNGRATGGYLATAPVLPNRFRFR